MASVPTPVTASHASAGWPESPERPAPAPKLTALTTTRRNLSTERTYLTAHLTNLVNHSLTPRSQSATAQEALPLSHYTPR